MTNLDEAFERFQRRGLEYGPGFSNHGPMAAEALQAIGHPALIPALVDIYEARLPPLELGSPLTPEEQVALLGDRTREADWLATFDGAVEAATWRDVLASWLPKLLPGSFASAFHALLRVAHGARALIGGPAGGPAGATDALSLAQQRIRVRELALGLGHWAAHFQPLPGVPGAQTRPGQSIGEAFARLPLGVGGSGAALLSDAAHALETEPGFAEVIEQTDLANVAPEEGLGAVARVAARLYLLHPEARIAFVHAVTGPSAMRLLLPLLPDAAARRAALGFAFQGSAALYACFGRLRPQAALPEIDAEVQAAVANLAEVRYRAACSLEEHSIKLCEAALREHAIAPDPVWPLTAADAALKIGQSRGGRGG